MVPDNTGNLREVATKTLSAIVAWSIAGVGVATAISCLVLGAFALFFILCYSLIPAVILGNNAVHLAGISYAKIQP
jgi:hypothetical protein